MRIFQKRENQDCIEARIEDLAVEYYPQQGSHGFYSHIRDTVRCFMHMTWKTNPQIQHCLMHAIIMYHDSSLAYYGRDNHAGKSAELFRMDMSELEHEIYSYARKGVYMAKVFTPEEIQIGVEAIQDHRNSNKQERLVKYGTMWRSPYGEYLAAADRGIPHTTVKSLYKRSFQYNIEEGRTPEENALHAYNHMREKFGSKDMLLPDFYKEIFHNELLIQDELINTTSLSTVRTLVDEYINNPW